MRPTKVLGAALIAVLGVGALAGCSLSVTEESKSYQVTEPVTKLVIRGDHAAVRLTTGDGPISVTERLRYSKDAPKTEHRVSGGTLELTAGRCGRKISLSECEARFEVQVPANTVVDIEVDAGQVDVRGLAGDLTVVTDAGKVDATDLRSKRTRVESDAGAVLLRYAAVPDVVDARTDAGRIEVRVPPGTAYAVDASTDAGKTEIAVDRDATSPHKITARTSAGLVKVDTAP